MNRSSAKSANSSGLLATGSSRQWEVTINESLDRANEWSAELEGPNTYLVFQVHDLTVVSKALRFLQQRFRVHGKRDQSARPGDELLLGKFGAASVSLLWDNEESPRCFIVIGPRARSTIRLTLHGDDIPMLIEALHQVANDLASEPNS